MWQLTRRSGLCVATWQPMCMLTNQDREVIENTRSRVKIISKLTNFKIKSQIEGCIGK